MSKLAKLLAAAGIVPALMTSTALSQTNNTPILNALWTLYEDGIGFFEGHYAAPPGGYSENIVGYVNGHLQLEPISGMTGLYYNWGVSTLPGDVVLLEPQTSRYSDLLRFDGLGGVYFFSDMEPGENHLADVPQLPPPFNPVFLDEVGPEGNNGAFYTPLAGQPGFDTSGILPGVSYHFVSDVVPEPSIAALSSVGVAVFWILRRRKV